MISSFRRLTIASIALLVSSQPLAAQYSFVGSRASVGGNGYIDWSAAGANFTEPGNPFSTTVTNTGTTATISQAGGSFIRMEQSNGWNGNFNPGDAVLWTYGNNGPMTVMFDNAVGAVGANYSADYYGNFTGRITALDQVGNALASFDFDGITDGNSDGSAVFAGISSANGDIWGVRYSGVSAAFDPQDFAINRLEVNTGVGVTSVVPEPSSIALSAFGLIGLAGVARRRRAAQQDA